LSEILGSGWDDVNFEKRTVKLRTRKRKGGKLQTDLILMSATLFKCLKKRWNERDKTSPHIFTKPGGGRYTKDDKPIREMMEQLCERLGSSGSAFMRFDITLP
jgi:integrase